MVKRFQLESHPPLRTRSSLVLSSVAYHQFADLFNISIVLPCPSASFSASCCATTARTLPRNKHYDQHHLLHPRPTDSPHIQTQPRASSRSRPACAACPARRAALTQTPVAAVVVVVTAAVADPTPRAASPKVRSLALPCPAFIAIPPLGTHTARVRVGSSVRCWPHALGINRLFFTHARTHDAISLQPPPGLPARDSRITCSNVSLAFDLRPLRRCHHTNSPAVRARATPSDVG